MDPLEDRVNKQDVKLAKIEILLENVATNLDRMANSMVKQELVLEKLANLEENTKDSINRVHKRIDENEKKIEMKADKIYAARTQKMVDELDPLRFMVRYPKLTIVGFTVLYLATLTPFRESISAILKVL